MAKKEAKAVNAKRVNVKAGAKAKKGTQAKAKKIDRSIGDDLIEGMTNALAYMRGEKPAARVTVVAVTVPRKIDVAAIRARLGLSQSAFAARFGFSVHNVRNWEQGIRQPEGVARAYLTVIDRKPEAVQEALSAA